MGAHINPRDDGRHHGTQARDHFDEAVGGFVRSAVGWNVLATRRVTYQKGVANVSRPSRARVASNPYA